MIHIAERLQGVGEYYFSKKLREIEELNKQGKNIINLGVGSPDQPPHPEVIKILQEESSKPNVHAYQSYKGSAILREAFAEWYKQWYGVQLDAAGEILPLIGSKEGIMHVCMTYFEKGSAVLVPNPGYPTYASAVKLSGATPLFYDLREQNNYQPDFDQLETIIKNASEHVKGVFVNYPHMPSGQRASKKTFELLIAFARQHDILICHDNPYSFILNDEPLSLLSLEGAKDVVLELNSLSKSHNMAGWRVGVLCGAREKIDDVLRFKSNMDSGMFLPVQLAAAKALSLGKEWYDGVNNIYKRRREKAYQLLDALQCDSSKNQSGMFLWARIPARFKDAYEISDEILYNKNVFITPGGIFGNAGDNYVRISLCATEEKIGEAIRRVNEGSPDPLKAS